MRGNYRSAVTSALLVLALVATAGCSLKKALRQTLPERRNFILEAARSATPASGAAGSVAFVRGMTVSPRYEGEEFVYKRGESEFSSDFYNRFLTPPDLLVTQEVHDWIRGSGLFGDVVQSGSLVVPTHAVEGQISALYGDYDAKPPRAVLEIELALVGAPMGRSVLLFHGRYREEIGVDDGPASLVAGWNTALARILTTFEADLRKIDLTVED